VFRLTFCVQIIFLCHSAFVNCAFETLNYLLDMGNAINLLVAILDLAQNSYFSGVNKIGIISQRVFDEYF